MQPHIEKEFKLLLTPTEFTALCETLKPQTTILDQTNIYFDTNNHDLSKQKMALRIRYLNNQKIITLKYYNQDDLMEIELLTHFDNPCDEEQIRILLQQFNITSSVIPIVKIHTIRHLYTTKWAELCIDKNTYDDKVIDFELEYEVKQAHDDITTFLTFIQKFNLTYEKNAQSKLVRAFTYQKALK